MQLNKGQERAVKLAKEWWNSLDKFNRPFIIQGGSGCGKTTSVRSIIESFNLREEEIRFVTFTGKAASVLTSKNNPATTIHKLIYLPKMMPNGKVIFKLREKLEEEIRLLVIDEFSQINDEIMKDLESFKVPMILLGDPNQHQSFAGKKNIYLGESDVMLTEVMRQALDNPIIYLSMMIREGKPLRVGTMGDQVRIISKDHVMDEDYLSADQIITVKNRTSDIITNHIRKNIFQLESPFPYVGEKIMILRNNWNIFTVDKKIDWYIFNGLIGEVKAMSDYIQNIHAFRMDIRPEFFKEEDTMFKNVLVDGLYFLEGLKSDDPFYKDEELKKKYDDTIFKRQVFESTKNEMIGKATFGYASTTFKMQGSEYNSVLYYDEFMGSKEYHQAARYVAVTRAKERVTILI